jgi:uncharacterized Zn-binding protein involved in type VI secretion
MGNPIAHRAATVTSHGGTPILSATKTKAGGTLILRKGDTIACPVSGHGTTTITQGSATVKVEGKEVAFNGATTSCGAVITNGVTSVLTG